MSARVLDPWADLTVREARIAGLIGEGLANQQIAARLGLQLDSVKKDVERVFRKVGVRNRTELVARMAQRPAAGLIRVRLTRAGLTVRECEVVELAIEGLPNREIGPKLGICANTVKTHVQRVYHKLGVSGRAELAARLLGAQSPATAGLVGILSARIQHGLEGLEDRQGGRAAALYRALDDLRCALLDDAGGPCGGPDQVVVACALLGESR